MILMMSEEVHLHIDDYINKQNCLYRADANPKDFCNECLSSGKVTVWCGISKMGIIGAVLFKNQRGQAVTENSNIHADLVSSVPRACDFQ